MRRISEAYRRWLMEHSTRRDHNQMNIIDAPWHTTRTELLTYALFLESSGQLRSLNRQLDPSISQMEIRVKIKVLVILQERLNDAELVLQDETLAALGCLVNYEVRLNDLHRKFATNVFNLADIMWIQ